MKKLILICCLAFAAAAHGQSLYNNHLYTNNLYSLNPSYAGNHDDLSVRFQSALYPSSAYEAPEFISVFMEAAFFENLAAGGNFHKEVVGSQEQTFGQASLAYKVGFADGGKLGFGLGLGFSSVRIQTEKLNLSPYVDRTDPVLALDDISQDELRMSYGMSYLWRGLEVGAALPNMLNGQDLRWQEANFHAGYTHQFGASVWKVRPNAAYFTRVEQDNVFDAALQLIWNDRLWAQGGTRTNGAQHAGMGINLPNIQLGYVFGWSTGEVSRLLQNKHELMISFSLSRHHNVKLGNNRLAAEKNEEENYRNLMNRFDHLIRRYDEVANEETAKSEQLATKQEQELEKLNEEIAILKSQLEVRDHTVVVKDELLSDKIEIKKGHYVIVATCRRLICAEDITRDFARKGVATELVLNRAKGLYYITSGFYEDYQKALEAMMQQRDEGVSDAWVLVNDFEE